MSDKPVSEEELLARELCRAYATGAADYAGDYRPGDKWIMEKTEEEWQKWIPKAKQILKSLRSSATV